MNRLKSIALHGYKTIRDLPPFELGSLTVLIGANGAGKSNFISFFRLMNWMLRPEGGLQEFVARQGGANALLHDGVAVTPQMSAEMVFESSQGENQYAFRLHHAAGDNLVFADEVCEFETSSLKDVRKTMALRIWKPGQRESSLQEQGEVKAQVILAFLRGCRIYQFHNTSETARIKQHWPLEDDVCLKEDAANLASFLQRLSKEYPQHYRRIQETIRSCVPFFGEFIFSETASSVSLRWRERDSDLVFGAFQASDGMLRLFALITLLLQPKELLPSVLILDEPELGLHPGAIGLVAELIRKVSLSCQVILATQSTLLVNYFQPEEVVVLNRQGRVSEFRRLSNEALKEWLDDYSLSELWEKNVIGGQPL